MEKTPDIGISFVEDIPTEFFDEFRIDIENDELEVRIESRPRDGIFFSIEWFLPTVIVAYIGKSYFDAFFKEMGKEHYQKVKEGLSKLTQKTMETPKIEPVMIGSLGKVDKSNPYTQAFSIFVDVDDKYTFKLLIEKYTDNNDYNDVVLKFLDFIAEYHLLGSNSDAYKEIIESDRRHGTILVHLNPVTNKIEWKDHVPPEVRKKQKYNK